MWQDDWKDSADQTGQSFGNDRVYQRIEIFNREYNREIVYTPLRTYMESRFIPAIVSLGPRTVVRRLGQSLLGEGQAFTQETRVLALMTGLRETGLPLFPGYTPRVPARFETLNGQVYLRNFGGSGLDYINRRGNRTGVLQQLDGSARSRPGSLRYNSHVIRDDPDSSNPDDVLINQVWLRSIFAAYLRSQLESHLTGMQLDSMPRPVRLFWRSLCFGAQGGNNWRQSAQGRSGLRTIKSLMDLLGLAYADVRLLWQPDRVETLVNAIDDSERERLASLARKADNYGRIDRIREQALQQIARGLSSAVFFQAIKIAAISEGWIDCMQRGVIQLTPTP